jgi:5-methylthioadenosine/S-adenosylhomocysteine deaminase
VAILIKNAQYVVRSASHVESNVDVLIEGHAISAIGHQLAERAGASGGLTVLDGRDRAIIPGFVNAHTHLYQCFLRGLGDGLELDGWLRDIVYPFRQVLREAAAAKAVAASSGRLASLEMLKNGTTSFIDMEATPREAWEAWQQVGIRGTVAFTFADRGLPPPLEMPLAERQARLLEALEAAREAASRCPTLGIMLAPATPSMCTQALLLWAGEIAQRMNLSIQTHAAATAPAHGEPSSIAWLDQAGLLSERTSIAQCVHLTAADVERVVNGRAIPVHCPKSNMKLGSGVAPVPNLLARGVPVALGNDGPASNDLLDMFEEMRAAALLHKLMAGPAALPVETVFAMATENGARAAGINAGRLDPGRLADVVLIDLNRPHLTPPHDIVPLLVYCGRGSDVDTVIVNGRIVVQAGKAVLVDEAEAVREARAVAAAWLPRAFVN